MVKLNDCLQLNGLLTLALSFGSCRLRDWSAESSLTLNTDNRLVSNTNMPKELGLAASTFDLTPKQMKDIVLGGFKRSFFPVCLRRMPRYITSH